ncbi:GNAT family N-acetyltransferase [Halopiger goleimassiliensis]|uniref:GNAT family N-acetyltransferase n=1 Tax=Halopiger goleimassiliensis TaxID=1293048 RepID=UPI0006777E1A|nr:GNAT family N-acetyltransferase [Halopiger goleimassiliensis]
MVDYRPIPDERALFHRYRQYAFRPEAGPRPYDPDEHDTPRARMGERRGIFPDDGDDPRCVCRHYWLAAHVRGEDHPTAGLASVATPPEHRRQGYVRRLLEASLAEYRDRDCRFSVLWPFQYAFYRQYGWEAANRIAVHECAPSVLSFARDRLESDTDGSASGRYRRLTADEYGELEPVYEEYRKRHALALERDESWWRHRVFAGHDDDPYVYAYERDGTVRGYLVYAITNRTADESDDGRTMAVDELVAADHEALLSLLAFCADHDSQVARVEFQLPESEPFHATVADPDEVETTLETGPMVRIVDVAATLSALAYPDVDASITFAVDDPLADWNRGTFELSVSDGTAACEPTAEDRADVSLDVAALSQLVVGTRSASTLERTGDLTVDSGTALETLDALFPSTTVYLGEFF